LTGAGQPRAAIAPLGGRTTYSWSDGFLAGVTDGAGNVTSFSYTTLGSGVRSLQAIRTPTGKPHQAGDLR